MLFLWLSLSDLTTFFNPKFIIRPNGTHMPLGASKLIENWPSTAPFSTIDSFWSDLLCIFLHRTSLRPSQFYPTTLTVSIVSSDIKIDLVPSLTGCILNPTAYKRSVLKIRIFGYLQEEKGHHLFICLLVNTQ